MFTHHHHQVTRQPFAWTIFPREILSIVREQLSYFKIHQQIPLTYFALPGLLGHLLYPLPFQLLPDCVLACFKLYVWHHWIDNNYLFTKSEKDKWPECCHVSRRPGRTNTWANDFAPTWKSQNESEHNMHEHAFSSAFSSSTQSQTHCHKFHIERPSPVHVQMSHALQDLNLS